MARLIALTNPRRKTKRRRTPPRTKSGQFRKRKRSTRARKPARRKRRRNPATPTRRPRTIGPANWSATTRRRPPARRAPARRAPARRRSPRRCNPSLFPKSSVIGDVALMMSGWYLTKAISLLAHRGWTEKITNPIFREVARDAAVVVTAVGASWLGEVVGIVKGKNADRVLTGGLAFALHRAIKDRVQTAAIFQGKQFPLDLLTGIDDMTPGGDLDDYAGFLDDDSDGMADYMMDDGSFAFGDEFDGDLDGGLADYVGVDDYMMD